MYMLQYLKKKNNNNLKIGTPLSMNRWFRLILGHKIAKRPHQLWLCGDRSRGRLATHGVVCLWPVSWTSGWGSERDDNG